jgi:DNA helicase HerA-like ATPase
MVHPVPDAALDADIAILGKKGRGRTFAAKGLVERLLTMGRRVLVLDPLSVWWGLKASADGKSPDYPIAVFGGSKADIPIAPTSGHALSELLASAAIFRRAGRGRNAQGGTGSVGGRSARPSFHRQP